LELLFNKNLGTTAKLDIRHRSYSRKLEKNSKCIILKKKQQHRNVPLNSFHLNVIDKEFIHRLKSSNNLIQQQNSLLCLKKKYIKGKSEVNPIEDVPLLKDYNYYKTIKIHNYNMIN